MSVRKILFQLHKILGITTGLVVFIVAITGCCWTFKDEIESLYDDYKKVTPQDKERLTPTKARDIAKEIFPNNSIHGTVFKKADDAIEVIFYDATPEFYQSIFLNPYTGEVIKINDHLSGFFAFVLKGHMRLWLPKEIGEQIVGVSILIFLLIIISGVFLWVPKQRKNLKKRMLFDWKNTTGWKRKNFDLHSILGFYVCFFAFIIALTGSIMSYNWLKYGVYKSIGGEKEIAFIIPENKGTKTDFLSTPPMDLLITKLSKENPTAVAFELHYPKTKEESIYVEISNSNGLYYDADFRFFDQNTLEEIGTPSLYGKYENAKTADKILRMNYDIHIGAIGGIVGKIIAFLSSLLIATLPITGILLWYGRKYKNK
ncbi:PepSY-associated TM helix domain-containing protein [Polaribacter gangjinensis]|uniref:Sulfite reductase n=1 Tax=Polaribacter gangjinensis TaxID=574710 RepID=A0A2S7WB36_9FLAO|nr:PepSY-associated TM helix domain-containing protein [Polaribacter gangjinensis]PQJ74471.1 sulfite reductase [Polaribacter gangjinensis]